MKYINLKGITNSTSGISRNISEKDNTWYLDLLNNGHLMVSKQDVKIGIFSDFDHAIYFFLSRFEVPQFTKEEEDKAFDWLIAQLQ